MGSHMMSHMQWPSAPHLLTSLWDQQIEQCTCPDSGHPPQTRHHLPVGRDRVGRCLPGAPRSPSTVSVLRGLGWGSGSRVLPQEPLGPPVLCRHLWWQPSWSWNVAAG